MPRRELFDLAVERADTYLSRLLPGWERNKPSGQELAATIELWYLRTRFAYRVPLEEVVAILLTKPPVQPDTANVQPGGPAAKPSETTVERNEPYTPVWRGGPEGNWKGGPQGAPGTDSESGG